MLGGKDVQSVGYYSFKDKKFSKFCKLAHPCEFSVCCIDGDAVVIVGGKDCDVVRLFHPSTKQFSVLGAKYPVKAACAGSVKKGAVYVTGGDKKGRTLGVRFPTDAIKLLKDGRLVDTGMRLSVLRSEHCMVGDGKWFVVIGGFDEKTCETVNVVKKHVKRITSMNEKRAGAACVIFNGMIYVMGGYNGHRVLSSVECYDKKTTTWTTIAPMTTARRDHCACVCNNKIYVFGGSNQTNTFESFDPTKGKWSYEGKLPGQSSGSFVMPY